MTAQRSRRDPVGPGRRRRTVGAGSAFTALGLEAGPDLTDDEVRAAWRRIAAACHPDRADGGDPDRFAAAAAAYTTLRTRFGRGEALADIRAARSRPGAGSRRAAAGRLTGRIRAGRPWRLMLRAGAAAAAIALTVAVAGAQPDALGLSTGILTWLTLTGRHDLAPGPGNRGVPAGNQRYRP